MAKKTKNPKLSRQGGPSRIQKQKTGFGKHAEILALKKLKNRENKKDAVNRIMKEAKKNKKVQIKMTQGKKSRFDLDGDDLQNYKLTHKGMEVEKIEDFEEAGVASDEEMEQEYVENFHFDGF